MGVSPKRNKRRKLDGLWNRGGVWYYSYTHPITNRQIKKSAKTSDRLRAKHLRDIEVGQSWDMKNLGSSVKWNVCQLMDWAADNHWSFKEKFDDKHFRQTISKPLVAFGKTIAAELLQPQIIKFIKERDGQVKRSSINRELVYFRSAYDLAIKAGFLKIVNPFSSVPIFDEKALARHRTATPIEEAAIVNGCEGVLRDIVTFAFNSGFRAGQIRLLKWADIDFTALTMRTESWKGRGYKVHIYKVPIFQKALKVLLNQPRVSEYVFTNERGEQIPKNGTIHSTFPRVIKKLSIQNFHFHDIRHTFGTNHYRRYRDILGISKILGHTKSETTQIYLNLTDEDLRQGLSPVSLAVERPLDTREIAGSIPAPGNYSQAASL